jgi:hypothetical protein
VGEEEFSHEEIMKVTETEFLIKSKAFLNISSSDDGSQRNIASSFE